MPGLCVGKANEHNQALTRELVRLHEKYPAMGLDSLYHMLKPAYSCSRGRMHRLMKAAGIHSLRKNAYKATTNSRHSHPIAPNLLQRQFSFAQPNLAWGAISPISPLMRAGCTWLSSRIYVPKRW